MDLRGGGYVAMRVGAVAEGNRASCTRAAVGNLQPVSSL